MSLMTRAAKEIEKKNASLRRIREQHKEAERTMRGVLAAGVGATGAALIDARWGEEGEAAKVLGVPVNAAVGGVTLAGALAVRQMPMRLEVGALGLGMGLVALARFVGERVDFSDE